MRVAIQAIAVIIAALVIIPAASLLWWAVMGAIGLPVILAGYTDQARRRDRPTTDAEREDRFWAMIITLLHMATIALICWQWGMLGPTLTAFIHAVKAVP